MPKENNEIIKRGEMAADCEINLEREFSPSVWSKRFKHRDEVFKHHVEHAEKVSAEVVANIPHKLDIPYGDTDNQRLDIFGTDLPDDAPILVFIHGGYWQELSRQQSRYPAGPMHAAGIRTVIVGYDLCPFVTLYDIVRQIERAARFVFDYAFRNNSKGIYFAGHSAGAHLIAKLLASPTFLSAVAEPRLLQAAILISGVYDLTSIINTSVNKCLQLTQEDAKDLSPHFNQYFHLSKYSIRLYILAGENDSYTFKKQTRDFYDKLLECCFHVQNIHMEIKDHLDHFDIMETITENENYLTSIIVNDITKYLSQ